MTAVPDASNDAIGSHTPPRVRASDTDRAAVAALLQEAVARGLLTHDEGGERLSTAFAARFVDELPPLTADLPPTPEPIPASPVGWLRLGSTLAAQLRYEVQTSVASGVRSRRFVVMLLAAVLLIGMLVTVGVLAAHGLLDGGYEHHLDIDRR
ncbi:DUF1707 domain-containing protein [Blastococcus sp. CT_GayMR16]|uniref:DUF1707 SHOCT-like domain-containing protein n=1 Tax=Blastococcus sp. CT_GayMR16 TaxID=2559607 RepID=UPI0010731F8F|nr:DUF1707 domain-containing protein [Blastococcus sp. CT_GayMR16]TFV91096.1 DUF1707 domain-containing protein [Blastococcus sp. CT_GayMR16]